MSSRNSRLDVERHLLLAMWTTIRYVVVSRERLEDAIAVFSACV
jgi:hypothetical protein